MTSQPMKKCYYEILGVDRKATSDEIKSVAALPYYPY